MTSEELQPSAPVFDLTIIPDSDSEYGDALKYICETVYQASTSALDTYWNVGDRICECIREQVASGKRKNVAEAMRQLACDLHDVTGGNLDVSEDLLRKMHVFRTHTSSEQLVILKRLGMPISKALIMCKSSVSDDIRDSLLAEVETGSLDPANLGQRVDELCPEGSGDKRGGDQSSGPFKTLEKVDKRLMSLTDLIESKLLVHSQTFLVSESIQPDELKKFSDAMDRINALLDTLSRTWQPIYSQWIVDGSPD